MKYAEGTVRRVFLLRFDNDDDPISAIKELAQKEGVNAATIMLVGALREAEIVAGPQKKEIPPTPSWESFNDAREILGFGTLFKSGEKIHPHIHIAAGRGKETLVGCLRRSPRVFITVEAIITEIDGVTAVRKLDQRTGVELLIPFSCGWLRKVGYIFKFFPLRLDSGFLRGFATNFL